MKLSVVIPVYNEHETLLELLDRVTRVPIDKEIIVVDDRSSDGTTEVLKGMTRSDIRVLFHGRNQGKGAAVRTGVHEAAGDYVVIQDADLEYDPNDYPRLLAPIQRGEADVVYGSRFKGKIRAMTPTQRFGNQLLTLVTNLLYGTSLTDMETCYKVVPTALLRELRLRSRRFDFEPEVTAKLLKRGQRIVEVPITYTARAANEGKKIGWTHGFPALWCLIKYRFTD